MTAYEPRWDIDLREGVARENAFVYVLLQARVEHKRDRLCQSTGRIAVEYETSERPHGEGRRWKSGISVTEADWWAIEYAEDAWLIVGIERLKALARRAIQDGKHGWVGDDDRFHNAFVPVEWCMRLWREV